MLFKPSHIGMILSGTKTATRRVWKKPMVKVGGIYKCKTKMLDKKYFAKIEVNNLYKQKLGDMKEGDAKKEGYSSLKKFFSIWYEINGIVKFNQEIYVIEFKLIEKDKDKE